MSITTKQRTAYHSDAAGRDYLTLRAACMAQVRYSLRKKYGEPFEADTGAGYDPFYDEEMQPLVRRYFSMLMRKARKSKAPEVTKEE